MTYGNYRHNDRGKVKAQGGSKASSPCKGNVGRGRWQSWAFMQMCFTGVFLQCKTVLLKTQRCAIDVIILSKKKKKIQWRTFKKFFSRTTGPISTKLGTKHWIQFCSNKRSRPFPRRDNTYITKIHWRILKIFLSSSTRPISTKLSTTHSKVKDDTISSNEGPCTWR